MATPLRRRTDQEAGESTPLRVLVVEDDAAYRSYLSSLLPRFGFSVTAVGDGAEALVALRTEAPYDMLLVDCEMPRVSGLALIASARQQKDYRDTFAIMLTGRTDPETKISALGLGFDDFITKTSGEAEIAAKLSAARRVVSRHKKLDETARELYGLAMRDELTGLFNRRFFFAEAERFLQEDRTVNLVLFDLDDFKRVNDSLGHLAGDRILRDIGGLFLRRTRHEDLIARYGGDEFVMLISTLDLGQVAVLADRVTEEIARLQWTFGTETVSVGATIGLACSSFLQNPSVAQLISAGDRDLYKNKWMRKNPEMDPSIYEYDAARDAQVLAMLNRPAEEREAKKKAWE